MALETTWHTPTGWLVVHDLLVMGRTDVSHRRTDYRRAPTDFGATGVLLRTATCIGGQVEVMVDCSPLFNYGTTGGTWSYRGEGYVSMTVAPEEGDLRLDLAGNIGLGVFTHLALIEAVSLLIASELAEDVKSAGWDPAASTGVRSG